MADWWDRRRRLEQWWHRWQRQIHRRWEAWCVRRQAGEEVRRKGMEAVKDELIAQALAKSILDKSSKELRESLLSEVWEQRSRFRLTTITPVGVIDETADDKEDAGTLAEVSPDDT